MNLICAETAGNTQTIVTWVILGVLIIAMLVFPYFTQKKRNQQYNEMLSGIKVGDLVKTAGGIIGKVTKITDKGEIKTIILETGSKTEKSYMEFDIASIYCVLKSTKVEESKEEKQEETAQTAEEKAEPEKAEEKPVAKKPTAKKSTPSKNTTKKTTKK